MIYTRNKKGFTIIELLVVVAIIAILASVAVSSLTEHRAKTRDAKRMQDLLQIRTAIELYHLEHGHYPITSTWTSFNAPAYVNNGVVNPNASSIAAALAPYLSGTIEDPVGATQSDAGYLYRSNSATSGRDFCLLLYRVPENMHNYGQSYWNVNYPGRCGSVNSSGQCTGSVNSIYIGVGEFENGC